MRSSFRSANRNFAASWRLCGTKNLKAIAIQTLRQAAAKLFFLRGGTSNFSIDELTIFVRIF
jgi:hypothetical protein